MGSRLAAQAAVALGAAGTVSASGAAFVAAGETFVGERSAAAAQRLSAPRLPLSA
jgi:hypothetical protein